MLSLFFCSLLFISVLKGSQELVNAQEGHCDGLEVGCCFSYPTSLLPLIPCTFVVSALTCSCVLIAVREEGMCTCINARVAKQAQCLLQCTCAQVEWTELNRKNMDPVLAARTVVEQQMVSHEM